MAQSKPHIVLIAYYFPPAEQMGGARPFRFFKYLRRLGYECDVITAAKQSYEPHAVHYVEDGLAEHWKEHAQHKRTLAAYAELLIPRVMFPGHIAFVWARSAASRVAAILKKHPNEKFVLVASYPPLGVLLAALLVKLRHPRRICWIADFRYPIAGFV
jgi:hypothetical protein